MVRAGGCALPVPPPPRPRPVALGAALPAPLHAGALRALPAGLAQAVDLQLRLPQGAARDRGAGLRPARRGRPPPLPRRRRAGRGLRRRDPARGRALPPRAPRPRRDAGGRAGAAADGRPVRGRAPLRERRIRRCPQVHNGARGGRRRQGRDISIQRDGAAAERRPPGGNRRRDRPGRHRGRCRRDEPRQLQPALPQAPRRARTDLPAQGLLGDGPHHGLQRRAHPRHPRRPPAHRDEQARRPPALCRHRRARRPQRHHPRRPGDGHAGRRHGGVPELRRPHQGRALDRLQADDAGLPADHRQDRDSRPLPRHRPRQHRLDLFVGLRPDHRRHGLGPGARDRHGGAYAGSLISTFSFSLRRRALAPLAWLTRLCGAPARSRRPGRCAARFGLQSYPVCRRTPLSSRYRPAGGRSGLRCGLRFLASLP